MCKTSCILVSVGVVSLWWLFASALLWTCWNRVFAKLFKLEKARYPQALLLLATIGVILLPCWYLKKMKGHHCGSDRMGQMERHHHCCGQPNCESGSDCNDETCKHDNSVKSDGNTDVKASDDKSKKKAKCRYERH
jgi:hypothetical protein